MCEIVIKELISDLFEENKRLLRELKFTTKYFEKYRHLLLNLNVKCVCLKSSDNQLLIDSLEKDYKTIITDGCAQHSTQTTTTHNWPLDTQTTPVGHRSETITTEDQLMTAEEVVNERQIETDTRSDGCVDNTNDETMSDDDESVIDKNGETLTIAEDQQLSCRSPVVSFGCDYNGCDFLAAEQSLLDSHRESHERSDGQFRCDYDGCDGSYNTERGLKIHRRLTGHYTEGGAGRAIPGPPYSCQWPDCTNTSRSMCDLERHVAAKHTDERPYGCDDCPKRYVRSDQLEEHRRLNHSSEPMEVLKCHFKGCHFETTATNSLRQHLDRHYKLLTEICPKSDCAKRFMNKAQLKRHMSVHSGVKRPAAGVKPYHCQWPGCESSYTRVDALTDHHRKHTGDLQYACDDCSKRFPSKNSLGDHRRRQHLFPDRKRFRCDVIGCAYETNHRYDFKIHGLKHLNIRQFACEESDCGKRFVTARALRKHQLCHSDDRPKTKDFRCDYKDCRYAATSGEALTKHKRWRHEIDRRFVCSVADCGKRFFTGRDLKTHVLSHSTERPFRCDWPACEAALKSQKALDSHLLRHGSVREFVCSHDGCGKSFVTKGDVRIHEGSHELPYACEWPECDQRFRTRVRLNTHVNDHNGVKPYKCQIDDCEKCFASKNYLNRHHREVHKMFSRVK